MGLHPSTLKTGNDETPFLYAGTQRRVRIGPMTYAKLIRLLMDDEPRSYRQLAEILGLHWRTLQQWIAEMKRQKLVYIAAYGPDSRGFARTPLWSWGVDTKDVRPTRKTSTERSRKSRAGQRAKARDKILGHALVETPCPVTTA